MHKIAIVGPRDLISGFQALGVSIFNADTPEDALDVIKHLRKNTSDAEKGVESYAVVMVVDSLLKKIPDDEYQKITTGALPTLLSIPDLKSDSDAGLEKLKSLAEKAIGSDILS